MTEVVSNLSEDTQPTVENQSSVRASGAGTLQVGEQTSTAYHINPWQGDVERVKKDMMGFIIGIVIFITITFVVEIATMNLDRIKDKDIYLNYNYLYKEYFDENSKLRNEVGDLKHQIELLRIKNSYLK